METTEISVTDIEKYLQFKKLETIISEKLNQFRETQKSQLKALKELDNFAEQYKRAKSLYFNWVNSNISKKMKQDERCIKSMIKKIEGCKK